MYRRVKDMCEEMGIPREMRSRLCHRKGTVCFKYGTAKNSPFMADEDAFKKMLKRLEGTCVALLLLLVMAGCVTAKAETVKGSKALGGVSLAIEQCGRHLYDAADLELLSEVMYHENGNNSDLCLEYTGSVVLNRVATHWGENIHDVLYAKGQYSTVPMFYSKPIPKRVIDIAKGLLLFGSVLPEKYVYQGLVPQTSHYIEVDHEYFCY